MSQISWHQLLIKNLLLTTLENSIEEAEQYSRRNNLRVANIPEKEGEDTDKIVLSIARALNADISPSDIDRSHRVGKPKRDKHREILVKFATYRARERIYTMRSALKGSRFDGVFLYEDLTRVRSKLLYDARVKVKGNFLRAAWSADGRLFIKDVNEKIHKLTGTEDIVNHSSSEPVKRDQNRNKPKPAVSSRDVTAIPATSQSSA